MNSDSQKRHYIKCITVYTDFTLDIPGNFKEQAVFLNYFEWE